MKRKIKLIVAAELGFCIGVRRSIEMTLSARNESDGNVTILNELVHNRNVMKSLEKAGIGQAFDVRDVPAGRMIISAHGTAAGIRKQAEARGLDIIDTTCPLVIKVHRLVEKLLDDDYHIIVFGDRNHDEIKGFLGYDCGAGMTVIDDTSEVDSLSEIPSRCALISQTTQNLDEFEKLCEKLKLRFPGIRVHNTICKPTRKRQEAAMKLASECKFVYVVGSPTSANSKRLVGIAHNGCGRAILVESPDQIKPEQLNGVNVVGLTAGASSPDSLIAAIINRLSDLFEVELITTHPKFKKKINEVDESDFT